MNQVVFLIQTIIMFTVPLMLVALAGVFSERSGIINIALEGIMIFGAFIAVFLTRTLLNAGFPEEKSQLLLIIVIVITMLAGGVFSLLLAFSAINLKADQTIGGTALNLLAPALVLFFINIICNSYFLSIAPADATKLFMLNASNFGIQKASSELNFFSAIFLDKIYPTTYYAIIIYVVLSIILYTTKFGLQLRSCGEHPQASDSLGINVVKYRYIGVFISGCLASFGGLVYSLTVCNLCADSTVAGMGFLALAVMIFGNWKPLNIAFAALLFGSLKALSACSNAIDVLNNLNISRYVYNMLPFIITIVVLAFTSKNSRAPKAEGQPYDKGKR